MADWCDLALGNPLDEQSDFDGERADSVGSQTPPSASQSARSLKSPRVHRNIEDLWPVGFQWTSSGLVSGLASGLPVDLPFWWWVRGEFSVANGQVLKKEPRKAARRLERGNPASPIQIRILEQKIVSVTPL
ncbi:hypothetical protein E4U56_006692 [Claviceps arundinis]|uniref:Uncharacterized protein n=1 Tax=Claviceps arundinis TaxID=1623583 RepID=A0A9P7SSA6_9HYPO|nr:hypothetical protein E4U56_006692 [Claviceps arundinis]